MSPVSPSNTAPFFLQNVSQTDGPRPSSLAAPSTWYEAVATPQTKSFGKRRPCRLSLAACSAARAPWTASATLAAETPRNLRLLTPWSRIAAILYHQSAPGETARLVLTAPDRLSIIRRLFLRP